MSTSFTIVDSFRTPDAEEDASGPASHASGDQSPPTRDPAPRRFRLTVAYDGYAFHGWQRQEPKGREPLRTAQGVLQEAVQRAMRAPVEVVGASRTDAGVHAEGQVAAFSLPAAEPLRVPLDRLHLAINRHLPDDIAVRDAREVDPSFEPIGGAWAKAYRYTIHNASWRPIFNRYAVFHCWFPLDVEAMNEAAEAVVGTHDYASLANAQHGRESTVRTIFGCRVSRDPVDPVRVHLDVAGSGFLYHMVRILGGTLVEIGRGHWPASMMAEILAACDRQAAGPTLPPHGLCLKWIRYPGEMLPAEVDPKTMLPRESVVRRVGGSTGSEGNEGSAGADDPAVGDGVGDGDGDGGGGAAEAKGEGEGNTAGGGSDSGQGSAARFLRGPGRDPVRFGTHATLDDAGRAINDRGE